MKSRLRSKIKHFKILAGKARVGDVLADGRIIALRASAFSLPVLEHWSPFVTLGHQEYFLCAQ
jgi:hypothetical protein